MKELTEVVKEELIKWLKNPTDVNSEGICFTIENHLYHIFGEDSYDFYFNFSRVWLEDNYKEFSGSRIFPVPSPTEGVNTTRYFTQYKGKWNEEYKNSRMNLLKAMQDSLDFDVYHSECYVEIQFGANYENNRLNID